MTSKTIRATRTKIVLACIFTCCLTLFIAQYGSWWLFASVIILSFIMAIIILRPIDRMLERHRQFSGRVSHELRTPLSVIKMKNEVALLRTTETDTTVTEATREEMLETMRETVEEVDRISEVIQFLKKFSESESGAGGELAFSKVDISEIVEKSCKLMDAMARKKEVSLSFHGTNNVHILGNHAAIDEICTNLLKNAVAYTPREGKIDVTVTRKNNIAELCIKDTGIGIPKKDLSHIFEPFYRGENAFSQRTGKRGSGIGLTVVKEIVALHGAKLSVDSELGAGTAISIRFPIVV